MVLETMISLCGLSGLVCVLRFCGVRQMSLPGFRVEFHRPTAPAPPKVSPKSRKQKKPPG
jgi:hypothetical protein